MNAVSFALEVIYCVAKLYKVHVFDNFEGNESFKDILCVVDSIYKKLLLHGHWWNFSKILS